MSRRYNTKSKLKENNHEGADTPRVTESIKVKHTKLGQSSIESGRKYRNHEQHI